MNKFKIYFLVISVALVLFSCSKDDDETPVAIRDFKTQYDTDNATIEDYLQTTSIQVVDHPGFSDDQDVIFTKIPENGTEKSIWSYLSAKGSDSYPQLLSKPVTLHGFEYNIYYLKLRADNNNVDGKYPCQVDEVLTSYVGSYLRYDSTTKKLTSTPFESVEYPQYNLGLDQVIRGWSEILPKFKTGTYDSDSNPENPAIFNDFGAGVMFIPSGLGYFNSTSPSGSIPSYSPLVFSFKLYNLKRADQDKDGIFSVDEDVVNPDGDLTNDDTDGDGTPNYLDIDDDGDGKLTKDEIKDVNGVQYSFDAIPDCNKNTTDSKRIKRHLDKSCF